MREKVADRFPIDLESKLPEKKRKGRIAEKDGQRKKRNVQRIAAMLIGFETRRFQSERVVRTMWICALETSLTDMEKNRKAMNQKKLASTSFPSVGVVCLLSAIRSYRMN
nr:hypothetical protein [uncultured Dubosiella sp.]